MEFGNESQNAAVEWFRLNDTWNRRNRNLSFGKRTAHAIDQIDPRRVVELELAYAEKQAKEDLERRKCELRKRLDVAFIDEDCSSQFVYQLMLNGSSHLEAVYSRIIEFRVKCYYQYSDHFIEYLLLLISYIICNSYGQKLARKPHFAGPGVQPPVKLCGRVIQGRSP